MADIAPTHAAAIVVMIVCILSVVWIAHRLDCRARRRNAAAQTKKPQPVYLSEVELEHLSTRDRREINAYIAARRSGADSTAAMAEHQARLARLRMARSQDALREDPMRRHTTSPCVIAPASMAEPPRPTTIGDSTTPACSRRIPASAVEE